MCLAYPKRSCSNLATAVAEFRQILSSDQTAQLSSFSSDTPTADDIVQLTDDIMKANAGRKSRILASRVQELLRSVQQYCTIVDTYAGPNQIAALVWGSIKLVLLVRN
jgi:predicted metal-binding protein